ncbi:helicase-related protein [Fusicatenibacter sp.]
MAKLDLCMELIQNAVEAGHKILLFSQFTSMIEILTARMQKEKISYFVLQGSTKKELAEEVLSGEEIKTASFHCEELLELLEER